MNNGLYYAVTDGVATITVDRPDSRNSLAPEAVGDIIALLRRADADAAARCVLIQATGANFTVGGDIKGFRELMDMPADERFDLFERKMAVGNRLPKAILDVSKPVVVATRGSVAGAGVAICLAADFVVASDTSFFLLAHVLIGLCLDSGLSGLLLPAMGIKTAKRLALLGERITALQAKELGIVTDVVGDNVLEETVAGVTGRLVKGPATAMRITKTLLNQAAYADFNHQLALEMGGVAECAATTDFRTGIEAVLARQPAKFD